MKKFDSEFTHSYKTYSFGYCNYAKRETHDRLSDIYEGGYLPYSGAQNIEDIFYMARSARVALHNFSLSSENRRIAKKFDGMFIRAQIPIKTFIADERAISFCLAYFKKRHGARIMPRKRLMAILSSGLLSHVVVYKQDDAPIAYVLEVSDDTMTHFWFSFYDISLIRQSLGMWLFIDSARVAQEQGKKYFYVGTVYGEKGIYKTNFKTIAYWDGTEWVNDIPRLKSRSRSDHERIYDATDEWKEKHRLF